MTALRLLILFAVLAVSGCAWWKPKSSSSIVEGESPTIKYTDREAAGGRIGGR